MVSDVLHRWIRLAMPFVRGAWLAWSAVAFALMLLIGAHASPTERSPVMPPPAMSVPAAPNQSEIRALVREVEQSPQFADKWMLRIEILETTPIRGPQFARVGATVTAFAFGPTAPAQVGDEIVALAEYIGDPRGGQFRLEEIRVVDQPDDGEG